MSLDEQLSALLSGDLPPSEAADLRRRIDTEPDVATRWARMLELGADLDDLPLPEVSDALVARALDAAGTEPAEEAPSRDRWTGLYVLAALAAGALLALGLRPAPAPVAVDLRGDTIEVRGRATILHESGRVDLDGRVEVQEGPDGLRIRVRSGAATAEPESGPVEELGASDAWIGPGPRAPQPIDECDTELARSRATLQRLQTELAVARGRLYTHEGEALPWPGTLPDVLRPGGFEHAVQLALDGVEVELRGVDCSEYPCAAVLYTERGGGVDWDGVLQPIADEAGPPWEVFSNRRTQAGDDDDEGPTIAVVAVLDPADVDRHGQRLLFRTRELILTFQPDEMR